METDGIRVRLRLLGALVFASILAGCQTDGDVSRSSDNFGRFAAKGSNLPGSYSRVTPPIPVSGAATVERFAISGGACRTENYGGQDVGDCSYGSARSEVEEVGPGGQLYGWVRQPDQAWYGWDILFPVSFPAGRSQTSGFYQFGQWKGWYCPHITFGSYAGRDDDLFLQFNRTTGLNDCQPDGRYKVADIESLKGRWTRVEVFVNWSTGSDGRVIVFINGNQVRDIARPTLMASNLPIPEHDAGPYDVLANKFDYGIYLCCTPGVETIRDAEVYFANVGRAMSREGLTR